MLLFFLFYSNILNFMRIYSELDRNDYILRRKKLIRAGFSTNEHTKKIYNVQMVGIRSRK